MESQVLFCGWWLVVNSITGCGLFCFLRRAAACRGAVCFPLWLAGNTLLTLIVLRFHPPGAFFWGLAFSACLLRTAGGAPWRRLVGPLAVAFALYTLTEGLSAVVLGWASTRLQVPAGGLYFQLICSLLFALGLYGALAWAAQSYADVFCRPLSAPPYRLVLVCAGTVLLARCGLRLDDGGFARRLSAWETGDSLWALFALMGGAALLCMALASFGRLAALAGAEAERAVLADQVRGQGPYLRRLQEQGRRRASFQHDIDNHLMVLHGLLRDKQFEQAERYAGRLCRDSAALPSLPGTGCAALDVLLGEKLGLAARDHVRVSRQLCFLGTLAADEVDLCILFSNLLDNALRACRAVEESARFLNLSVRRRGRLLVVEVENTPRRRGPLRWGIGLENVRAVAEKYQGTVELQDSAESFKVSVLLCL